jgi:UDPglucose--hexose-1-phosphate uridylyltransferase
MTSVRYNPITGDPVLFAPDRSARPNAFAHDNAGVCPFCPGNEAMTPPPSQVIERQGRWIARAFPNKYPASEHHEVIVESRDHNARYESIEDAAAIMRLYIDRYRALRARSAVAYVSLFKNQGQTAGASIDHMHSQVLASPMLPPRIARESAAFDRAESCPVCSMRGSNIIRESDRFTWFAPAASTMPYEQWVVPKRHISEPDAMNEDEMRELAALLQNSTSAMRPIASAYNWSFVAFPSTRRGHFYVEIFPRMTSIAGYELGTHMFIEIVDPARAAEVLRK